MVELLFYRLIQRADDEGYLLADATILRAECFPLREVREADLARWTAECAEAGLIRLGISPDGKLLLQIENFGQRVRSPSRIGPIRVALQPPDYLRLHEQYRSLFDRQRALTPLLENSCQTNDGQMSDKCPPYTKEKDKEKEIKPSASAEGSSEPNTVSSEPPPAPDPPVFVYPTVGSKQTWGLTPQFLHTLQERYPNLDVLEECRKALAWTEANPQRRKTAQGMPRFLVNWLNKAVDGRCAPPTPALLIAKSEEAAAEAQRAKILAELRQAAKR